MAAAQPLGGWTRAAATMGMRAATHRIQVMTHDGMTPAKSLAAELERFEFMETKVVKLLSINAAERIKLKRVPL